VFFLAHKNLCGGAQYAGKGSFSFENFITAAANSLKLAATTQSYHRNVSGAKMPFHTKYLQKAVVFHLFSKDCCIFLPTSHAQRLLLLRQSPSTNSKFFYVATKIFIYSFFRLLAFVVNCSKSRR
jgi:hypothetical protein